MLAAPAKVDLSHEDDELDGWATYTPGKPSLLRTPSVNSWGVTVVGGGYNWEDEKDGQEREVPLQKETPAARPNHLHLPPPPPPAPSQDRLRRTPSPLGGSFTLAPPSPPVLSHPIPKIAHAAPRKTAHIMTAGSKYTMDPLSMSPTQSPSSSRPMTPNGSMPGSPAVGRSYFPRSPSSSRPGTPRPRRRSSQQRVSLIAGRVSIIPPEPTPPLIVPQRLVRSGSARSLLSVASSTGPPTPDNEKETYLGGRTISEFVIEKEIGRGAYGLVKRAREMNDDGSLGPPVVVKQIIKSRILADCWKKHPKHGTIPIEIYVMNAISSTSYVLPAPRPWNPQRPDAKSTANGSEEPRTEQADSTAPVDWIEGKVVKGHPNICPMLDFFEDDQYYYMVMPSSTPEPREDQTTPPSDLFDLVEAYPQGLPPDLARTYLGQIADAMSFLHSKGIVHRDIKDENVVLGPNGTCILIDFGSSGLLRRKGWDTFSGTLDYAGPEILRGERYFGREQDVWAFGVVAFVLLCGECPFTTAAEAQEGLTSPFSNAAMALDERCGGNEDEPEQTERDGGGGLADAAALIRACLQLEIADRPTFDKILQSRFLMGAGGWGAEEQQQ